MINTTLLVTRLNARCLQVVAEESGVSYSCLSNIRHGRTKLPQHRTLVKLLPVLGLKLEIKNA
ncbi:hypothetical protein ZC03_059 [Pseudomonas phage ZC03]|uniref:Uncharacterized protein n=1 Tax=Pseudomonas phage ZC03 TaxID=1622115 RepID=A0A1L2C982_9CAUD|nr:transcriptional regulator [Pseudomonas phage ZC03]AMD43436.1 hypothetical protein ZC03_059 [Pseudomonas phage ZC03]